MHLIVIPAHLAQLLHEPLRRHYSDDPTVEVIVERRTIGDSPGQTPAARRRTSDRAHPPARPKMIAASGLGSLPPEALPYTHELGFWSEIDYESSGAADAESLRLVASFQQGDETAFEGLYHLHFASIYNFLRLTLNSEDQAEDATQDVFMSAHDALSDYRHQPNIPFFAWLHTLARNQARSRLRQPDPEPLDPDRLREITATAQPWLSERALLRFVEQLPSRDQQQAFMLRELVGLSVSETASVMGKTKDAVMQLATRARTRLRREMRDDPPDWPPQRISMRRRAKPSLVLSQRRSALSAR